MRSCRHFRNTITSICYVMWADLSQLRNPARRPKQMLKTDEGPGSDRQPQAAHLVVGRHDNGARIQRLGALAQHLPDGVVVCREPHDLHLRTMIRDAAGVRHARHRPAASRLLLGEHKKGKVQGRGGSAECARRGSAAGRWRPCRQHLVRYLLCVHLGHIALLDHRAGILDLQRSYETANSRKTSRQYSQMPESSQ